MSDGASPSFLNDLAYAIKSVGKTLLSILLLVLALIVGAVLIGVVLVVTAVLWLGHKVRLIREPPSVIFRRFQGRAMGKFIQWRMAKSGLGGFPAGGGAPGAGAAPGGFPGGFPWPGGFPGSQQPTAENASPADVEQARSLDEAYRQSTGQTTSDKEVETTTPPNRAEKSTSEPVEVDAESVQDDLEDFHGSLDEFMRLKNRRSS